MKVMSRMKSSSNTDKNNEEDEGLGIARDHRSDVMEIKWAKLGLHKINMNTTDGFQSLVVLELSDNEFKGRARFGFSRLGNLRKLDLSGNKKLESISDLHHLVNLRFLDLSRTNVGVSVRNGTTSLPRTLETLKMNSCSIVGGFCDDDECDEEEVLIQQVFSTSLSLPNVHTLMLNDNMLGPDLPDLRAACFNAKSVSLRNNEISSLRFARDLLPRELEHLDLTANDISLVTEFRYLGGGDEFVDDYDYDIYSSNSIGLQNQYRKRGIPSTTTISPNVMNRRFRAFQRLERIDVCDNPLELRAKHYEYDYIAMLCFASSRLKRVDGLPISQESQDIAATMLFRDDFGLVMESLYFNLYLNACDANAWALGRYLKDVCVRFRTKEKQKNERSLHGAASANGLFSVSTFVPSRLEEVLEEELVEKDVNLRVVVPTTEKTIIEEEEVIVEEEEIVEDDDNEVEDDAKEEKEEKEEEEEEEEEDGLVEFPERPTLMAENGENNTNNNNNSRTTLLDDSTSSSGGGNVSRLSHDTSLEAADNFLTPGANRALLFGSPIRTPIRSSLKKKNHSPSYSEAKTNSTQASSYKTARSEDLSDSDDFSAYYHHNPLHEEDDDQERLFASSPSNESQSKNEKRRKSKSVSFKIMLEEGDVLENFYSPPKSLNSRGGGRYYSPGHAGSPADPSSVSESPHSPARDELDMIKRDMHHAVQRAVDDPTPERLRFARDRVKKLVQMKQKALSYYS